MNGPADSNKRPSSRQQSILLLLVWILLWCFLTAFGGELHSRNEEGNNFFAEEKFDDAEKAYIAATRTDPESPALRYNIANVQFKKQKFELALEEYQKAILTDDKSLKAKIYYNQGNALYKSVNLEAVSSQEEMEQAIQTYQRAIDSYTETLKIEPNDEDAKYNIEFIRKMLKELAQKSQEQQPQQQQGQQGQTGEESEKQEEQSNDEQQNESDDEQETQARAAEEQPSDNEETEEREADGRMTPEEAKRILDSLEEEEQNQQRMIQIPGGNYRGEDW